MLWPLAKHELKQLLQRPSQCGYIHTFGTIIALPCFTMFCHDILPQLAKQAEYPARWIINWMAIPETCGACCSCFSQLGTLDAGRSNFSSGTVHFGCRSAWDQGAELQDPSNLVQGQQLAQQTWHVTWSFALHSAHSFIIWIISMVVTLVIDQLEKATNI